MKYLLVLFLIVFTGCSNKKYFEPKEVQEKSNFNISSMASTIKSKNSIGATLGDSRIISTNGISTNKIPNNFKFLNNFGDLFITSNYKDKLLIGTKELNTKEAVIAASIKNNILAMIYSNNSIELYDLDKNKTLFKEYLSLSLANDTRIVNPFFMNDIILFPTLNGKIVIVSLKTNKIVKDIIVDAKGKFNNLIYLNVVNDVLITASANKVISIANGKLSTKEYEVRDIIVNKNSLYIATIDGQIIKTDLFLNEEAKKKFKYSKIHALAFSDSLYAIESQGFIIKVSEDFSKEEVIKFDFDNEQRMIVIDNKVYYDSNYLTLP